MNHLKQPSFPDASGQAMAQARWHPHQSQPGQVSQQARLLAHRRWRTPPSADIPSFVADAAGIHSGKKELNTLAWIILAGGLTSLLWALGQTRQDVPANPHPVLGGVNFSGNTPGHGQTSKLPGKTLWAIGLGVVLIVLAIYLFSRQRSA